MTQNSAMIERAPYSLRVFLVAVVYVLFGKLGTLLSFLPEQASPIFPAAGVAVACLILYGNRTWPAIFIGACILSIPLFEDIFRQAYILKPLLEP